jgi:hypothetical protein
MHRQPTVPIGIQPSRELCDSDLQIDCDDDRMELRSCHTRAAQHGKYSRQLSGGRSTMSASASPMLRCAWASFIPRP